MLPESPTEEWPNPKGISFGSYVDTDPHERVGLTHPGTCVTITSFLLSMCFINVTYWNYVPLFHPMESTRGLEDCIGQLVRLGSGAQDKDRRAEENKFKFIELYSHILPIGFCVALQQHAYKTIK